MSMSREQTSIIYFGTTPFAVPALRALVDDPRFRVDLVVSQPDRPAGRKGALKESAVTAFAREHDLDLYQPTSLKDGDAVALLREFEADVFVVAAYGKIIPQTILDLPKIAPLNLHGSILPKHRGAAPIQTAILEGDTETGVTLMRMDAKMDHGPLYTTASVTIDDDDTYTSLEKRLADVSASLLTVHLPGIIEGSLEAKGQRHDLATFTKILTRADGKIDWSAEDALHIERKVRAFDPWPGCFTTWGDERTPSRLKIVKAKVTKDGGDAGTPYENTDGYPSVHTVMGSIVLLEVQPEGKRAMDGREFLRGYPAFLESALS